MTEVLFCNQCYAKILDEKFALIGPHQSELVCRECFKQYLENKKKREELALEIHPIAAPVLPPPKKRRFSHLERIRFLTPEIYWRERNLKGYFKDLKEFKDWCNRLMIDLTSTTVYMIKRHRKHEKRIELLKHGSESEQKQI